MDPQQFDNLTRALGAGIPRRQFIRGLLAAGATGLLTFLGIRYRRDSATQANAQTGETKTFLPLVMEASDDLTVESLKAAILALEGGATDIAITPKGTERYRRTLSGDLVTHEEMLVNGQVILSWDHGDRQSIGQFDGDRDGYFEKRTTVTVGAIFTDNWKETVEYSPVNQRIIQRQTLRQLDEIMAHVVWEEADASGTLQVTAEFDTTLLQEEKGNSVFAASRGEVKKTACSFNQDETATLNDRMIEAAVDGVKCLRKAASGTATDLTEIADQIKVAALGSKPDTKVLKHKISFECFILEGDSTNAMMVADKYPAQPAKIEIYKNNFFREGRGSNDHKSTLFHELLHIPFGAHETHVNRYQYYDRMYACQMMCFDPKKDQCHCTTCVQVKKCDYCRDNFGPCENSENGPTECKGKCCVGPCDENKSNCCPPSRICHKKITETPECCLPKQECFPRPDMSSFCCTDASKICGTDNQAICCPLDEQCYPRPDGSALCCTSDTRICGTGNQAICCPLDEQCYPRPDGSPLCCTGAAQLCGTGNQAICCMLDEQCYTRPDGSPLCCTGAAQLCGTGNQVICCIPGETCTITNGSPSCNCSTALSETSLCCPPPQICGTGNQQICCSPGQKCTILQNGVPVCSEPTIRIYCNCNKTCYNDLATCQANCKTSLGCFTAICGEATAGQCP